MPATDPLERGEPDDDDDDDTNDDAPLLAPPPTTFCNLSRHALMYGGVCLSLALQNSSYTLVRRFGHGVLKEEASSQSILAVGEIMKLGFCVYMVLRDKRQRTTSKGEDSTEEVRDDNPNGLSAVLRRLAATSIPMAVPAIIFLAMNLRTTRHASHRPLRGASHASLRPPVGLGWSGRGTPHDAALGSAPTHARPPSLTPLAAQSPSSRSVASPPLPLP
jgi:hypothetical protein